MVLISPPARAPDPARWFVSFIIESCRGVAQTGSAPALGAGGPRFKSARPDHKSSPHPESSITPLRSEFRQRALAWLAPDSRRQCLRACFLHLFRSRLACALPSAFVCHCMLYGASSPPQASGTLYSTTYPGRPLGYPLSIWNVRLAARLRAKQSVVHKSNRIRTFLMFFLSCQANQRAIPELNQR
jgi:hypothetical protein